MSKNTGGPAFPCEFSNSGYDYAGLTIRDYFAAKAMEKIQWHFVDYGGNTRETMDRRMSEAQAAWCYAIADAMIAEREKNNE
jgi:hypothetical protein